MSLCVYNKMHDDIINSLYFSFDDRVKKAVASAEAQISAECQSAIQKIQQETGLLIKRAQEERDEYQLMFTKVYLNQSNYILLYFTIILL